MSPSDAGDSPENGDSSGHNVIPTDQYIVLTNGERGPGLWLRRFALASVVATFALIVLGGIVRVTGSGLGCGGEWPLCDGSLIPPLTKEDIIEYSHRLVASGIVGPLVAGTFLIALFRHRHVRAVLIPSGISVVLLLVQAGLGGVTVLTELPGHVVAAHMALAQALLACLILVAVASYNARVTDPVPSPAAASPVSASASTIDEESPASDSTPEWQGRFPLLAGIAAVATYALILSGSYVTATPGALAACPQWPLCDGSILPSGGLQAIHMLHRLVAAVVGIFLIYTLYRGYKLGIQRMAEGGIPLMFLSAGGIIVFLTQVFIGALAIWTSFPVAIRAYHIGLATAIWGIIVAVSLLSLARGPGNQVVLRRANPVPGPGTHPPRKNPIDQ